jgi:hypothetical protein
MRSPHVGALSTVPAHRLRRVAICWRDCHSYDLPALRTLRVAEASPEQSIEMRNIRKADL